MSLGSRRIAVTAFSVVTLVLKLTAVASAAGVFTVHLCGSWTPATGSRAGTVGVARSHPGAGISTTFECPSGISAAGLEILANGAKVPKNRHSYWEINAPAGVSIVAARTIGQQGMVSYGVNQKYGWYGDFYYRGGRAPVHPGQVHYRSPLINSPYFGWEVVCRWKTCDGVSRPGEIAVLELQLTGAETSGPAISVTGGSLGAATGFVRGWWPIGFTADGPTGACQLVASLGGVNVSQPVNEPQSQTTWHQCPAGSFSQDYDTAAVGSGSAIPLTMWARDAAYDFSARSFLASTVTREVKIDNDPVALRISGATDAPSTAGTQYLTTTATAGPSGVRSISCSLNGAPPATYTGSTARVAVSGIGVHHLSCIAHNNAVDSHGVPGSSAPAAWTLSIRQPSVSTVSFTRVVDALRCVKRRERVRVPARWVTAHYRGKRVRVRLPPEVRTVSVTHCHARIVRKRVRVHGRWRVERVVVLPHRVRVTSKRIPFGSATTVSGWLGTFRGNALGGQRVRIMAAPANGLNHFTQVASAVTARDGSWSARLPAGPSRIVAAVYDGSSTVEPATSQPANVIVSAAIGFGVHPLATHWGSTIVISGRLRGGYVPPAGELVVLWVGWPGGSTEIGHVYARPGGRFSTRYTFLRGNGSETYELWAATAKESDYPFAPARSRRIAVRVSPPSG